MAENNILEDADSHNFVADLCRLLAELTELPKILTFILSPLSLFTDFFFALPKFFLLLSNSLHRIFFFGATELPTPNFLAAKD